MRATLDAALKEAMKAKDSRKVSTLRLILAAIKERDIAIRSDDNMDGVSDDEILQILQKMVKQRRDSAATYEEASRLELAEQERAEIEIIESFMPAQMDESEIRDAVQSIVGKLEATGLKDMGRVMGALKEAYAGKMDFGKANGVVKELLG